MHTDLTARASAALAPCPDPARPAIRTRPMVGVLGGMGPAATADFLHKIVAATPARRDQDHLPLLIRSMPQIPDRSASILGGSPSPEPALIEHARALRDGGAAVIVMPCNTAHLWHDAVQAAVDVPVLHIVDPVLRALQPLRDADPEAASHQGGWPVGLLATRATMVCGLYPRRARGSACTDGIAWMDPLPESQERHVDAGIQAVKAGDLPRGAQLLGYAAQGLIDRGARALVLACTEIPLVLHDLPVPTLDATQLLAEATVAWALAHDA